MDTSGATQRRITSGEKMVPVSVADRVNSVDVLRGAALLGILLMNILSFGLPGAVGDNPTLMGSATQLNLWTWFVMSVLFEGKMRALFSVLFGAGLILMTDRASTKRRQGEIADIWIQRSLWLIAFGFLHGVLLWHGDILFSYGGAALCLYPFRKLAPRALLTLGFLGLALQVPGLVSDNIANHVLKAEYDIAIEVAKTTLPMTDELKKSKEKWEENLKDAKPSKNELQKTIARHRSDYWTLLKKRIEERGGFNPFVSLWDVAGMMFIGMGLMKLGLLKAEAPSRVYLWMMLAGFGIGIPVRCITCWILIRTNWDLLAAENVYLTYDLWRVTTACGHLGLILLICHKGWMTWLTRKLAAVGQMALTNYLAQTLICTTFFYGYGFGMFGKLETYQLYYVVALIWLFQLVVSPLWLKHFQYGPFEWLWRSLTYWQPQPMRKVAAHAVSEELVGERR